MNNEEIRAAVKQSRVRMWQIAEAMQIQDSALSRKLRHELPDTEKERIMGIIEKLSRGGVDV